MPRLVYRGSRLVEVAGNDAILGFVTVDEIEFDGMPLIERCAHHYWLVSANALLALWTNVPVSHC
jgi:hypothetical protein